MTSRSRCHRRRSQETLPRGTEWTSLDGGGAAALFGSPAGADGRAAVLPIHARAYMRPASRHFPTNYYYLHTRVVRTLRVVFLSNLDRQSNVFKKTYGPSGRRDSVRITFYARVRVP